MELGTNLEPKQEEFYNVQASQIHAHFCFRVFSTTRRRCINRVFTLNWRIYSFYLDSWGVEENIAVQGGSNWHNCTDEPGKEKDIEVKCLEAEAAQATATTLEEMQKKMSSWWKRKAKVIRSRWNRWLRRWRRNRPRWKRSKRRALNTNIRISPTEWGIPAGEQKASRWGKWLSTNRNEAWML